MTKLIFGCGYLGSRVARRWRDASQQVFVVTRSASRAAELAAAGYRPIVADVLDPSSLTNLPQADVALWAVGHDRNSTASLTQVFVDGLRNTLAALHGSLEKWIYVSSTGVYGQVAGEWVDEDSPCQPTREGGRACLAAERLIAEHPLGLRAIVLRMAGLYGPGRIPNAEAIRAGRPIAAPEDGYLNLIHVDDAAAVVVAAAEQVAPPRKFVISDGHPVPRRDYYRALAAALGAPEVAFSLPAADSPAAARAGSDKRIDNSRMRAEWGLALAYPTYREGLAAIVAEQSTSPTQRSARD